MNCFAHHHCIIGPVPRPVQVPVRQSIHCFLVARPTCSTRACCPRCPNPPHHPTTCVVVSATSGHRAACRAAWSKHALQHKALDRLNLVMVGLMPWPLDCSWYPWGFDSCKFVEVWRYFVETVRARTCRTVFMWAPAEAGGYPFTG